MYIRNVQKTGGASYSITLPKEWLKKMGIDGKSQFEIYQQNKYQLALKIHKNYELPTASIYIKNFSDNYLQRELTSTYLSGVAEIHIYSHPITYEQRAFVKNITNKLIGFEIFETTTEKIIIKNVSTNIVSVSDYTIKMIKIIQSMYADLLLALFTNNKIIAKDIIERDDDVDRIHLAIKRQFNVLIYTMQIDSAINLPQIFYFVFVTTRLERIADHIVYISKLLLTTNSKKPILFEKTEISKLKKISKYLETIKIIVEKFNKPKSHDLLDELKKTKANKFININKFAKNEINFQINDSINRIKRYIANIAEETINYTVLKRVQEL